MTKSDARISLDGANDTLGRITPQRRVILEELRAARNHPTADELYARVRNRMPRISLATVYRNLDLMARNGLIGKIEGGAQSRYDGMIEVHHHVRCIHCGCVEDIVAPDAVLDVSRIEAPPGFRILGHHLDFVGECARCRP